MKILGFRVLLERIPPPRFTSGGIMLHRDAKWQDDGKQWRVLAVGQPKRMYNRRTRQHYEVPIEVSPGDKVLLDPRVGASKPLPNGRIIVAADIIEMKW